MTVTTRKPPKTKKTTVMVLVMMVMALVMMVPVPMLVLPGRPLNDMMTCPCQYRVPDEHGASSPEGAST